MMRRFNYDGPMTLRYRKRYWKLWILLLNVPFSAWLHYLNEETRNELEKKSIMFIPAHFFFNLLNCPSSVYPQWHRGTIKKNIQKVSMILEPQYSQSNKDIHKRNEDTEFVQGERWSEALRRFSWHLNKCWKFISLGSKTKKSKFSKNVSKIKISLL